MSNDTSTASGAVADAGTLAQIVRDLTAVQRRVAACRLAVQGLALEDERLALLLEWMEGDLTDVQERGRKAVAIWTRVPPELRPA